MRRRERTGIGFLNLSAVVIYKMKFSTPRASDAAGASKNRVKGAFGLNNKRHQLREEVYDSPNNVTGKLNPQFVECLMGYPLGWTDCADSETRLSLK
jgi:hypothetical protein